MDATANTAVTPATHPKGEFPNTKDGIVLVILSFLFGFIVLGPLVFG